MHKRIYRYAVCSAGAVAIFALSAVPSFAAADTTLTTQETTLQSYFTDNLPGIIGLVIGVGAVLWLLAMAFKSVGFNGKKKTAGS